jgi:predicted RND superfamily exporter protein
MRDNIRKSADRTAHVAAMTALIMSVFLVVACFFACQFVNPAWILIPLTVVAIAWAMA